MKTSEFRKYLEENWKFEETEDCFKIHGVVVVNKRTNRLEFLTFMYLDSLGTTTLVKKIVEYACTPILEREEEKRYILIFPSCFDEFKYLNFNNITKKYGRSMQSIVSLNDVKTIFTQKEIDAMPFDTNFFIKEEVK